MEQYRDTLGANRRLTDIAQLQAHIGELHKTMDRLQELQADYRKLLEHARENIQDAQALEAEINAFVLGGGSSSDD